MCGLPGSGKSYQAQKLAEQYNANIHSSDAIREELLGDINSQDANGVVFTTLHNRVKEDLRNGKNCIYDACNISYKRRMAFLQELKKIHCEKICVLIATPYEECLKNNASRERHVPEYIIERMYRQFDIPWYYEGWDRIELFYRFGYQLYYGPPYKFYLDVLNFNQDNQHHALTLGAHCGGVCESLDKEKIELVYAGLLHDCGKPFCKTFTNSKGETTEQAHYYNHEHIGSYNSLFYDFGNDVNHLNVAILIRWHMQPYFWEKDNNKKQQNKYQKLWGKPLYIDIMKLHLADQNAH